MNIPRQRKGTAAITLLEILVVVVILGILAAVLFQKLMIEKRKAQRIHCVNNLHQIGLLLTSWTEMHQGNYPTFLYETNSSPKEFDSGPNAFRRFRIVSSNLRPPKTFICPAESDGDRTVASNLTGFNNSNLSYFVGLMESRSGSNTFAAGDRNLTNGTPSKNGVLELTASQPGGWTREMHKEIGNILLTDNSVQQLNRSRLQQLVTTAVPATNRLLLPILNPQP